MAVCPADLTLSSFGLLGYRSTWNLVATGRKLDQYTGELVYMHIATIGAVNEFQQLCKEFSE